MALNIKYLHALDPSDPFDSKNVLSKLEQVLSSGYLLSRRLLSDLDPEKGGFQGFDYISLCDYKEIDAPPFENNPFYKGYNAYSAYIQQSVSLILIKGNMRIIKPELIAPCVFDWDSLLEMRYLGRHPKRRFSDMPDEVQVKNKISLDNLRGITLPISHMIDEKKEVPYTNEMTVDFFNDTRTLLDRYECIQPIYDLETLTELKEPRDVEKVFQKLKNKE